MVAWIGVLISLGKSLGRLGYPGTSCHAKKHTGGYSASIDVFCDRVQCECGVREGEIVMCACADRVRRIQASLGKSAPAAAATESREKYRREHAKLSPTEGLDR